MKNLKLFFSKLVVALDRVPFLPEVLTVLFALNTIYWFFPGMMSYDSFVQYNEALGNSPLTDAHSALMGYIWLVLAKVYQSPGVMLVFHQLLYWLAAYVWARCFFTEKWKRSVFILVFGFWPPLYIISLHLWKDVGMLAGFALSSAFTLLYRRQGRVIWAVLAFVFLFYGNAMRLNAILGAVPVAILLAEAFLYRVNVSAKLWKVLGLTAVILVSQMFLISRISRDVKHVTALGTIFVWDIAAISVAENQNLYPSYLERQIPEDQVLESTKKNYGVEANFYLWDTISPYPPPGYENTLNKDFFKLVVSHPWDYLKHRLKVFGLLIGISEKTYYAHNAGIDENTMGVDFTHLSHQSLSKIYGVFDWLGNSIIYRVWFYIILGLILIRKVFKNWRNRSATNDDFMGLMLVLSGWLIVFPLLFLGPAADFRYNIWLIYSTLLAWLVLYKKKKTC